MRGVLYAIRQLCRRPTFTIAAILTLGIGVAASSLIFCVVRGTLLAPLRFREPNRLISLWEHHPMLGKQEIAPPDFRDWRQDNHSFEQMAAYTTSSYFEPVLTGTEGEAETVPATMASSNLLPVLGIAPSVGRNFTESEDRGAGAAVALISDRLWRRRFHRDPMIVGHSIKLDGEQYTIVGILPSGMQMPEWADIWIPLSRMDPHAFGARQMHVLAGLGRLKPGVT